MNLDNIDKKLLRALYSDSRITMKHLSEAVHLSQPSCAERLKKLTEKGIVESYNIEVCAEKLGYTIAAIVRIQPLAGKLYDVEEEIIKTKEIVQCDKVTGEDAFICRMHLKSISDLDDNLKRISQFATTNTSVIKSSPIQRRLLPLD